MIEQKNRTFRLKIWNSSFC
uniref:Uncharacterized protein n=1 Tax=Anguilla anguilla TaxID=7936 RepID=A0A0E9UHL4_ANGAN